jgi:hypothetical protein
VKEGRGTDMMDLRLRVSIKLKFFLLGWPER